MAQPVHRRRRSSAVPSGSTTPLPQSLDDVSSGAVSLPKGLQEILSNASDSLKQCHRKVRLFYHLLQQYVEDNSFPFVQEWVGPLSSDMLASLLEHDPSQQQNIALLQEWQGRERDAEDALLIQLKRQVQEVIQTANASAGTETVSKKEQEKNHQAAAHAVAELARAEREIIVRRVERMQGIASLEQHLRGEVFSSKHRESLEFIEDEDEGFASAQHSRSGSAQESANVALVTSIEAMLGKLFLFIRSCILRETVPRPSDVNWIGPQRRRLIDLAVEARPSTEAAEEMLKNVMGHEALEKGSETELLCWRSQSRLLDRVLWPNDAEALFATAAKARELAEKAAVASKMPEFLSATRPAEAGVNGTRSHIGSLQPSTTAAAPQPTEAQRRRSRGQSISGKSPQSPAARRPSDPPVSSTPTSSAHTGNPKGNEPRFSTNFTNLQTLAKPTSTTLSPSSRRQSQAQGGSSRPDTPSSSAQHTPREKHGATISVTEPSSANFLKSYDTTNNDVFSKSNDDLVARMVHNRAPFVQPANFEDDEESSKEGSLDHEARSPSQKGGRTSVKSPQRRASPAISRQPVYHNMVEDSSDLPDAAAQAAKPIEHSPGIDPQFFENRAKQQTAKRTAEATALRQSRHGGTPAGAVIDESPFTPTPEDFVTKSSPVVQPVREASDMAHAIRDEPLEYHSAMYARFQKEVRSAGHEPSTAKEPQKTGGSSATELPMIAPTRPGSGVIRAEFPTPLTNDPDLEASAAYHRQPLRLPTPTHGSQKSSYQPPAAKAEIPEVDPDVVQAPKSKLSPVRTSAPRRPPSETLLLPPPPETAIISKSEKSMVEAMLIGRTQTTGATSQKKAPKKGGKSPPREQLARPHTSMDLSEKATALMAIADGFGLVPGKKPHRASTPQFLYEVAPMSMVTKPDVIQKLPTPDNLVFGAVTRKPKHLRKQSRIGDDFDNDDDVDGDEDESLPMPSPIFDQSKDMGALVHVPESQLVSAADTSSHPASYSRSPPVHDYVCLDDGTGGLGSTFGYFPLAKTRWSSANVPHYTLKNPQKSSELPGRPSSRQDATQQREKISQKSVERPPLVNAVLRGQIGPSHKTKMSEIEALVVSVTRPNKVAQMVGAAGGVKPK